MKKQITIADMACQHCFQRIQRVLQVPGVIDFTIDLSSKKGSIEFDPQVISQDSISQMITDIGYTLEWGEAYE